MTAPAAAPVSNAIVAPAPAPRAAPEAAADRFAFAAMLDSLPGAAAKAAGSADEGSPTSNQPKQGRPPSAQPDSHPMLGDGAFLSSLPFVVPSALTATRGPATAVDASPLEPASTQAAELDASDASSVATPPAKPAVTLTGERAFHLALSTSGIVAASAASSAGSSQTDAFSFARVPAAESETATQESSALPLVPARGPWPTQDAPLASASAAAASLSPAETTPNAGAAPAVSKASAPVAPREADGQANPPATPIGTAAPDPAGGARKADVAASPSPPRVAARAVASDKTEPVDKADGDPPDPTASGWQPATQGAAFAAPLLASAAAGPSFASYDTPAATGVQRTSAPASAATAPAAPVREIDVDLSPTGLENVSMTMRLAGEKLSVVIRAASSQTAGSIEGARDAIADRLAAIGQPLDSLIIRQTGVNADANANGNAATADDSSTGSGARPRELGRCEFVSARLCSQSRLLARRRRTPRGRSSASGK